MVPEVSAVRLYRGLALHADIAAAGFSDVFVYRGRGENPHYWDRTETLQPSESYSGFRASGTSLAVSGATRLVGATAVNNNTGAAFVFVAPTAAPVITGFGSGSEGLFQPRGNLESGFAAESRFLPWDDYNVRNGEIHPAAGDVDGDGLDELVIGPGRGGDGWIAILDDAQHGYALLRWIQVPWPSYNAANGLVWPAVGDIDGDGRAEIVAGLGEGAEGWFAIFDDASLDYRLVRWRQVGWPAYNAARGETRPAVANIDGGTFSEIVIGLGRGGAGWLEVFDDAAANFAHLTWFQVSYGTYNAANGETFPAAGDLDQDGYDEVVVGLGSGSGGWVETFSDAFGAFRHERWLQVGWAQYASSNGEVHPAVGNVDGDSAPEIVFGLGSNPGQGGWIQILDDSRQAHITLAWKNAENGTIYTSGLATYPAAGRFR